MLFKFFNRLLLFTLSGLLAVAVVVIAVLFVYGQQLPNHQRLLDYELPMTTRLFAADGEPIARYATQHRLFQTFADLPPHLIEAFLSAEDRSFWQHHGLDGRGLARALRHNLLGALNGSRPQGGSTITQQVSKNFLLTNEVTLRRKIKELLLSFRLERTLSKQRILELYLNGIYFGRGNWGVTAASLYYFGRLPQQLDIAEVAYLAALPKSPNRYHPIRNHQRAVARRNWIINRMLEDHRITAAEAKLARSKPLQAPFAEVVGNGGDYRSADEPLADNPQFAAYFNEEVRRQLLDLVGNDELYRGGLAVHTNLDIRLQKLAEQSLRRALIAYDRKLGWRGEAVATIPPVVGWRRATIANLGSVELGSVDSVSTDNGLIDDDPDSWAVIILADNGSNGFIRGQEWQWAKKSAAKSGKKGTPLKSARPLKVGDEVYVEHIDGKFYALRQIPEVSGAIVAMETTDGRVMALYGGFSQRLSEYNRATQALRQPGSAFKPLVFLTALEQGLRPTDTLPDAPFIHDQGGNLGIWRPNNFGNRFNGTVTLSEALARSLNLATVRLADRVGIDNVRDTAIRLGLYDEAPPNLSIALGSRETTLLKLTAAFAAFANGGNRVIPTLIDYVQDRHGNAIYPPSATQGAGGEFAWHRRSRVIAADDAATISGMLQKVVTRGTARRAVKIEGSDVGGKTGTTNDAHDAWFIGFTPKLAVGVFIGYDNPRNLGKYATGGSLAAPVFNDFVAGALAIDGVRYGGRFPPTITATASLNSPTEAALAKSPGEPLDEPLDEPLGLY